MSVTIDGAGSLIGVDQGLNIVGLTTLTGGIILDDSISHIGDTNTKIRFPAADTITAETGGSERLRIASDGDLTLTGADNVEIKMKCGTSSGNNILAFLNSGGTTRGNITYDSDNDFLFFNVNQSERLRITSDGKLGIGGLTNPGALLSIPAGESNTPRLAIESAVDDNDFTITQYEDGNGTYTMLGQNVKLNSGGNNTILDSAHRTAGILLDARNHGSIVFLTGGANAVGENLKIDYEGRVLVGPGAIATPKCGHAGIDIPNNDWAIIMGGSDGNGNRANNANKDGRFAGAHYVNAEEPVGIIRCTSGASANELHMGGGTSLVNAATQISLYTAANTTTTGGTERLRITSNGKVTIGDSLGFTPIGLLHLYQASNDPYLYIQRGNAGDSAVDIGGIFFRNSTNNLAGMYARSNDINDGNLIFQTMGAGTLSERVRITNEGRVHLGNSGHGTTSVGGQEISGQNYSALLKLYDTRANIWGMQMRRDTGTGPNGIFVRAGNASSNYSLYVCGTNESDTHLVCRGDGNVGVNTKDPAEHLHISGAVRRDTPGSSNIKFLEFSFELPSGTTTTIATVTGPVVSSMAIAKFEYVALYDYSGSDFYSGVEMASLRRSSSNSAYTYLQNSQIHAGGNNSNYQPNMFWQNGSNNTSDLMITTGNYVLIVGTLRITTYNLGLSRVISI